MCRSVSISVSLRNSLIDSQSLALTREESAVVSSSVSAVVSLSFERLARFFHFCLRRLTNLESGFWPRAGTGVAVAVDCEDSLGCCERKLIEGAGDNGVLMTRLHSVRHCSSSPWLFHPPSNSDKSTDDRSVSWYSWTVNGASMPVLGTISFGDKWSISWVRRRRAVVLPTHDGPMKKDLRESTPTLPCCCIWLLTRLLFSPIIVRTQWWLGTNCG